MAGRSWTSRGLIRPALLAALMSAGALSGAQTSGNGAGGTLSGKLTDLHSAPLNGAAVVLRNEQTGAETRGVTGRNGSFRFAGLEPGAYTVEAESRQLGRGRLEGVMVAAGHEAHVQAAMAFELADHSQPQARPPVAVAMGAQPVRSVTPNPAKLAPTDPNLVSSVPVMPQPRTMTEPPASSEARLAAGLAPDLPGPHVPPPTQANQFTTETLQPLPAPAELLLPSSRGMPAVEAVVLPAVLADEPLASFDLSGASHWLPARAGVELANASGAPVQEAVTTVVSAQQLQALPAAGRRWQDFVLDTPTASTAAGGAQGSALRGAGLDAAETTLDGASTLLAFGGEKTTRPGAAGTGGSGQNEMGQAWAGGRGSPVAEAAIHEVQTTAGNAEAEADRTAGGLVKVQTASGTNGLHGQGFWFDRQNTWGAQNPFTQWVKQTGPATLTTPPVFAAEPYTPPDHEAVWGLGVGSQIRRDKLFWFGAVDSYRRNDPGLATVRDPAEFFAQPSNDQMQVLAARLGLSSVNPVVEGLNAYSGMLSTLDGLLGPAARQAAQWVGFGRLDWQAAERHRFTLEGTGAHWNAPGGGLTRVSETYGSHSFGASEANQALLLARWEAFVTPNLLAVTQGSAGRSILSAHAGAPSAFEQAFLQPNVYGQLPQIVVDSRYGFNIGNPSRFGAGSYPDEHLYEANEQVDWVRGNLLVKGGFELRHNADATSLLRNQTGTYTYASLENFTSDALVFEKYGLAAKQDPISSDQHFCDQTGKVWRDSAGGLRGLGYLPCYSYYSQVIGPSNWNLSTNDWAGYVTAQWQPAKLVVMSGALRWEREQLPPPLAALNNPDLPLTQKLPNLGNDFGPRLTVAVGNLESHWPVLRLGYGMYFGRTDNATVETALTQTGSAKGDQSIFMRPTDNLNAGGAPPFPYVLSGDPGSVVKPGAVEFGGNFRNPEVHQAVAAVEEALPAHIELTASALVSLGRRLPISIDTNFDPAVNPGTITYAVKNCPETFPDATVTCTGTGPIKSTTISVPFYASWPAANSATGFAGRLNSNYQQISEVMSRANSTYEAAVLKIARYGRRGLSVQGHYTYAHAMDWNPNETTTVAGSDVLDPANFRAEYGTSNFDVRHSAAVLAIFESPWKAHGRARWLANGWMFSGIGQFRSGLPYTMRTAGALAEEITNSGIAIVGLGPGMNGSGGDNRVYGVGSDGVVYNIGRNTFRYPATWKADMRAGKKFDLGQMRQLEVLVESFNLFNHQNVTELETTGYSIESGTATSLPTLNYRNSFSTQPALPGIQIPTAFGQPLNVNATNFYRERQIQFGVRMRF